MIPLFPLLGASTVGGAQFYVSATYSRIHLRHLTGYARLDKLRSGDRHVQRDRKPGQGVIPGCLHGYVYYYVDSGTQTNAHPPCAFVP